MKNSGTFCCVFQYQTVGKGNQHSHKYDDFQNWLNMTSHETLCFFKTEFMEWKCTKVVGPASSGTLIIFLRFTDEGQKCMEVINTSQKVSSSL